MAEELLEPIIDTTAEQTPLETDQGNPPPVVGGPSLITKALSFLLPGHRTSTPPPPEKEVPVNDQPAPQKAAPLQVVNLQPLDQTLRDRKKTLSDIENTKYSAPWNMVRASLLNAVPVPQRSDIDNPHFSENESNKAQSDRQLKETTELYAPFLDKVSANVFGAKGEKAAQYITTDQAGNKQVNTQALEKAVEQQNALYKGGDYSKSYLRQDLTAKAYDYALTPDVIYTAQQQLKQLGLSTPQQIKDGAAKVAGQIYSNAAALVKTQVDARDKKVRQLGEGYKQSAQELNDLAATKINNYQQAYSKNEYDRVNSLYTQYVTELEAAGKRDELSPEQLQQEKEHAQGMFNESLSQIDRDSRKYGIDQFNQNDKEGYDDAMGHAYDDYTYRVKAADKKTKDIQKRIEVETKQKLQTGLAGYESSVNGAVERVYQDAWASVTKARMAKDQSFRDVVLSPVYAPGGNLGGYARLFGNSFAESIGNMMATTGKYFEANGLGGPLTNWMIGKGEGLQLDNHIYKPDISFQNFYHPSFISQAIGSAAATTIPAMAVGAVTRNPNLTATIATGLEAASNGGDTYQNALDQGMDPAEAAMAASSAAKWSIASFPAQLLESKLFIDALGGGSHGLRKLGSEVLLSAGANAAEEAVQTTGQVKALDPNRSTVDILLHDPSVRAAAGEGGLAGGLMQAGALATGGLMSRIASFPVVKGPEAQWLANIVDQHGVNRAKAIAEYYYNNNEISAEQKAALEQKIDGIATKTQEARALNLTPQQTQAVIGLSDDITQQQEVVNSITSPELKKAAEKTLGEKQKTLDEVVNGTAPLATLRTEHGTNLTVAAQDAAALLKDTELQQAVKEGTLAIQTDDTKVNKTLEELQATPEPAAAATTPAADLTNGEMNLLSTIQQHQDKIGGSYGIAIKDRLEEPSEQKGIVDAVVSQVQDDPGAAVDLFGKEVVDAVYKVVDEQTAAKAAAEAPVATSKGVIKKARGIEDLTDPRDIVLQHFANGGKINPSAIQELYGGKDERIRQNTSTEGERKARIGLLSNKAGGISELTHQLWEALPVELQNKYGTDLVFKEAIENVLQEHKSMAGMAKELVNKYLQKSIDQELTEHEAQQIDVGMRTAALKHVEELPETKQQELVDILRKYQDKHGFVDWDAMEKDSNGFDPDMLSLPTETRQALDAIIAKNIESRQGEHSDATAQSSGTQNSPKEKRASKATAKDQYEINWKNPEDWDFNEDSDSYAAGTTKNFDLEVTDKNILFNFKDKTRQENQIKELDGPINVNLEANNFNRVHIGGISESNLNQGFGKEIYHALIDKADIISTSSASSTNDAIRVWDSLIKSGDYYWTKMKEEGNTNDITAVSKDKGLIDKFIKKKKALFENPIIEKGEPSSINTSNNATTNIGENRSTEQHPGAVQGQPENREGKGSEREGEEPESDNSDVNSISQKKKQEIRDFDLLRKNAINSVLIEGMEPHVFAASKDSKIFDAIVGLIPVDMMNVLIGNEGSSQKLLHNQSMLSERLKPIMKDDISPAVSDAIAFGIARLRTKLLGSLTGSNTKFTSAELTLIKDRNSLSLLMGFSPIPDTRTYLPRMNTDAFSTTTLGRILSIGLHQKNNSTDNAIFFNKFHDAILQKTNENSDSNEQEKVAARKAFLEKFNDKNPTNDFAVLQNMKDPESKTRKLDAMARKLLQAKQDGVITENDFDKVSGRIDKLYQQLGVSQKVETQGSAVKLESQVKAAIMQELGETSPTEKITNKQKAKAIADNIRQWKSRNDKLHGGLLGVGTAIYDGLLETAATVIEAGGSVADAVQAAVEYLKPHLQSEKFKASEIQTAVENEFKTIGLLQEPVSRSIKQDIKAATDTSMKTEVVASEKSILKDAFRRIERISKDVFKGGVLAGEMSQGKTGKGSRTLTNALQDYLAETKQKGDISIKQLNAILKRAGAVNTESSMYDFLGYVQKVLTNADYQDQLQSAQDIRAQLKKANKNKSFDRSAVNRSLFQAFLRIQPEQTADIAAYTDIAQRILGNAKGVQVGLDEGRPTIKNESYQINNHAVEDYIDTHQEHMEQVAKDRLINSYKDLVEKGIIDPANMSLKDMKEIIDAIHNDQAHEGEQALIGLAKQQEKHKALVDLLDYQRMALKDWMQNQEYLELSKEQQGIVGNLLTIDTDQLSMKQLAKLNDVINNIVVNNHFVGAGNISILSEVQKNIPAILGKIKDSGIALGNITNPIINGLSSINLMTEFITKSTKLAGELQRLTGISGLFDGHARAKTLQGNALNEYAALKETMGSDIDNPINRFKRGVYARIVQHFGGSIEEQQQEFDRVKGLVRQSADRLLVSDNQDEVREGRVIDQVYHSLLEGSETVDEVTARMDDSNKQLVEFWKNKFADRSALTRESAELYNNQLFEDVENYTATKRKGLGGKPVGSEARDMFEQIYFGKKVDNKAASTKLQRSRSNTLMQGTVLNFDFDAVQSKAYYETNYDVETAKAIAAIRMLFDGEQSAAVFGNSKNSDIVRDSLRKSNELQKGKVPPIEALEKAVTSVTRHLQAKSARLALASVSQLGKQYISVAFNTLVNLGSDLPLYFKALGVGNKIELFNQFNIGSRGDSQAGYNKDVDLNTIDATDFGNNIKKGATWVSDTGKAIADGLMKPLVASDVAVARTSWLAYYMQDLKKRGIDIEGRDWANEHHAPDHEAAAYAEQMVSRSQVANDPSAQGNLYKDKRGLKGVLMNMLLPFSTFATNQRLRMTNDMQKIMFGGEKKEAYKSLAATAAEQVLFNAIKVYALGQVASWGAHSLAAAFGMWNDDDQKEYEEKQKVKIKAGEHEFNTSADFKKWTANSMSDFFFSGMGSATQNGLQKGMNALYGAAVDEENGGKTNETPKLFYTYDPTKDGRTDYGYLGLYSVLPTKLAAMGDTWETALTGKTDLVVKAGVKNPQTQKVNVTPKEQGAYLTSFMIDALGLTGISDADISAMNQKFKTLLEHKMEHKYGGDFTLKGKSRGTETPGGGPKAKGIKTGGFKKSGFKAK